MAVISSIQIDTSQASKSIADLEKELAETNEQLKQVDINSDAFTDLQKKAAAVQGQLNKINEKTATLSKGLTGFGENLAKTTGAITGGITAATAAMQMMGVENENVVRGIAKLQQLMAFTQGISALKDLSTGFRGLAASVNLAAGPLGIVAGILAGLVVVWKNWGDKIRESVPAIDTLATAIEKLIGKLKSTETAANEAKDALDRLAGIESEIAKIRLEKQVAALSAEQKALYQQYQDQLKIKNLELSRLSILAQQTTNEADFNKLREQALVLMDEIHDLEQSSANLLANPANFTEPIKTIEHSISQAEQDLEDAWTIYQNMLNEGRGNGSPKPTAPNTERESEDDSDDQFWLNSVTAAQSYYKQIMDLGLTETERFTQEQQTKLDTLKSYLDKGLLSQEQYEKAVAEVNKQTTDAQIADQKRLKEAKLQMASTAAIGIADILDSVASTMDQTNEKQFRAMKAMQISAATIQMMVGITTALSGAFTTKTGPWDIALAVIQAASIAASGSAQIANIAKQKYDSNSSTASTASVSSTSLASTITTPTQYSTAVENANIESAISDSRVYVVESDIQQTGSRVNVQETENRY